MAALLLALTPLWTVIVALYKWPARLRRTNRRLLRGHEDGGDVEMVQVVGPDDDDAGPADLNAAPGASQDGLQPPIGHHQRTYSASSVSDMAPLIEDNIPRSDLRFRRGPWDRDYDSGSDSD
jgi:hypothetical protein